MIELDGMLSVIMPAYNEEKLIEEIIKYNENFGYSFLVCKRYRDSCS